MDDAKIMREWAQDQLADCKRHYDLGDYRFLVQALRLSVRHDLPVPPWAAGEAEKAMIYYFENGGAPGRGKSGGHSNRHRWNRIHRERHRVAARELERDGVKATAFRKASETLRQTEARGEPREIAKSYRRIERALNSA